MIILAVGVAWNADYEVYAHAAVARQAGFSPAPAGALAAARPAAELSDAETIAQQFAQQLSIEHEVPEALYRDAERALGRRSVAT